MGDAGDGICAGRGDRLAQGARRRAVLRPARRAAPTATASSAPAPRARRRRGGGRRELDVVARRAGGRLHRVADAVHQALHALTRHVRRAVPRRLVGVTGSAGKTTTKELLAAHARAAASGPPTSPGNLNNLYGFPLALLGVPDDTEWMVAEMGMSTPGELRAAVSTGRPDVAVFTNVRPVHLEFFGTLDAIAEAKAELLRRSRAGRLDRRQRRRSAGGAHHSPPHATAAAWSGTPGSGGEGDGVALPAASSLPDGPARQPLPAAAGSAGAVDVALPLLGAYNVDNASPRRLAPGPSACRSPRSPTRLAERAPTAMRGVVDALAGGGTLIDDSYNSNPGALEQALVAAASLGATRRWAVLGDMLELGPEAPRFHREAGAARRARSASTGGWASGALARELAAGPPARRRRRLFPTPPGGGALGAGRAPRRRPGAGQGLARRRSRARGRPALRRRRRAADALSPALSAARQQFAVFNVFRYITFRTAGAALTALLLSLAPRAVVHRARCAGSRSARTSATTGRRATRSRPARRPWAAC